MAQWNHVDKTLYAKLVYYGPAFCGKTTNLEAIHKLTCHDSSASLLSVKTAQERTLFFDLLPFELGHILGYKVALKLYTVPGQVQYNATRRVVLSGTDAVVFVADSTRSRVRHNRDSLKDLAANMQANKLNPAQVPVLIQYNKQDVRDAMTPDEMEQAYGVRPGKGFPAVAIRGDGVMETFLAATKVMLRRLVDKADDKTREVIDSAGLDSQVDKAFEPYLSRAGAMQSLPSMPGTAGPGNADAVVVAEGDLMQRAVEAGLTLGEELAVERQRSSRMERESRTYRQLGEALRQTGATFDHRGIIDRTLSMASEVVGAAVISLVGGENPGARAVAVHRVWGSAEDPLARTIPGHHLLARFVAGKAPVVLNDLTSEAGAAVPEGIRERFHAIAAFPVDIARGTTLVAYAPGPDGRFGEADVRFLSTAAAHLAVGLEKARLYQRLSTARDRLEVMVQERTEELRLAYDEIRSREQTKDRFLSNLSHEMRTPLTTVTGAATFLRDYESDPAARHEMADAILDACGLLNRHLENMFRAVQLQSSGDTLELVETAAEHLVAEAAGLAGTVELSVEIGSGLESMRVDHRRVVRALANLLENAKKFGQGEEKITIRLEPCGGPEPEVAISVLDRNERIPNEDRERIFLPFEQGGDPLTGKPAGIGLGLYESKAIAGLHGGSLEYRERDGGGNEFRMVLPLACREAAGRTEVAGA